MPADTKSQQHPPNTSTSFFSPDVEYRPDPARLARRSISIFSRRGAETPEPKPSFIAQAAAMGVAKPMSSRQRTWLTRRRSVCGSPVTGSSAPKSPKSPLRSPGGTILYAVPSAPTPAIGPSRRPSVLQSGPTMPAVEEETASKLSEAGDKLSVISEGPQPAPSQQPPQQQPTGTTAAPSVVSTFLSPSQRPSPITQPDSPSFPKLPLHKLPALPRSHSQKQREMQTRVGVWVDGVVRWDEDPRPQSFLLDAAIEEETGLTPLRADLRRRASASAVAPSSTPAADADAATAEGTSSAHRRRPTLSVKIPPGQPLVTTMAVSTVTNPKAVRPIVPPESLVAQVKKSTTSTTTTTAAVPVAATTTNPRPTSCTVMTVAEESDTATSPDSESARTTGTAAAPVVAAPVLQRVPSKSLQRSAEPQQRISHSSSSCSSPGGDEEAEETGGSVCSKRSSATSVEGGMPTTTTTTARLPKAKSKFAIVPTTTVSVPPTVKEVPSSGSNSTSSSSEPTPVPTRAPSLIAVPTTSAPLPTIARANTTAGTTTVPLPLPSPRILTTAPTSPTGTTSGDALSVAGSAPAIPKKASARRRSGAPRSTKSLRVAAAADRARPSSSAARDVRKSMSMSRLDACDREFMLSAPVLGGAAAAAETGVSPTLSQAELELQAQLVGMAGAAASASRRSSVAGSAVTGKSSAAAATRRRSKVPAAAASGSSEVGSVGSAGAVPPPPPTPQPQSDSAAPSRSSSVHSVMRPPERAPSIPKRSRRREWRDSKGLAEDPQMRMVAQQQQAQPPADGKVESGKLNGPARRKSESEVKSLERKRDAKAFRRSATTAHGRGKRLPQLPTEEQQEKAEIAAAAAGAAAATNETMATAARPASAAMPPIPTITIDDGLIVVDGPRRVPAREVTPEEAARVSAVAAEEVLVGILMALNSPADLHAMAVINRGMYRVYCENEMTLLRQVSFNESPAACEFREWNPPSRGELSKQETRPRSNDSAVMDHTPATWRRGHQRDLAVIEQLKKLILRRCATPRREILQAMATPKHREAGRVNDAFWRLWCFCFIFGCGKGREDDITGQLDWLKGGLLAMNQGCVATVNTNLDFDFASVLLNAPEHFAKGNPNGLSASQLFDMTEMWTCLTALLQAYLGHVELARQHGVFDGIALPNGPESEADKEELLLEEWTYHLLTLGPTVVLEMAQALETPLPTIITSATAEGNASSDDETTSTSSAATANIAAGFALAQARGWTKWQPPQYNGSRNSFLKEPVARLYEERVAAANQRLQHPRAQERKERSRQRLSNLAKEITLRRQNSSCRRLPFIDMAHERPMSVFTVSRHGSRASSIRSNNSVRTAAGVAAAGAAFRSPTIPEETPSEAGAASTSSRGSHPSAPVSALTRPAATNSGPGSAISSLSPASAAAPVAPATTTTTIAPPPRTTTPKPASPIKPVSPVKPAPRHRPPPVSPGLEDRVDAFEKMSLQQKQHLMAAAAAGADAITPDRAVAAIVAMGFSPAQAREALRATDLGEGLRVDEAVELLVRGHC